MDLTKMVITVVNFVTIKLKLSCSEKNNVCWRESWQIPFSSRTLTKITSIYFIVALSLKMHIMWMKQLKYLSYPFQNTIFLFQLLFKISIYKIRSCNKSIMPMPYKLGKMVVLVFACIFLWYAKMRVHPCNIDKNMKYLMQHKIIYLFEKCSPRILHFSVHCF